MQFQEQLLASLRDPTTHHIGNSNWCPLPDHNTQLPVYSDGEWMRIHCLQQIPILFQKVKKELASNKLIKPHPHIKRSFLSVSEDDMEYVNGLLDVFKEKYPQYQLENEPAKNLYRLHFHVPVYDRRITARLVQLLRSFSAREYEVEVAKSILDILDNEEDYETFKEEFLHWRKKGLWYPLVIAKKFDPEIREAFQGCDFSKSYPPHIIKKLDAYAVQMHIKSDQELDPATHQFHLPLQTHMFMELFQNEPVGHPLTFKLWHCLRSKIHEYLPPSLFMYTATDQPTWGYENLQLRTCGDVVFFERKPLGFLDRKEFDVSLGMKSHFAPMLQHTICALGEKLLSKDLAICIMYPTRARHLTNVAISFEDMQQHIDNYFFLHNLEHETKSTEIPLCPLFDDYCKALVLPKPTTNVDSNRFLVAWKIDTPTTHAICTTSNPFEKVEYPCERKKFLLHHLKPNPILASIHRSVSVPTGMNGMIQQFLKEYVHEGYMDAPRYYPGTEIPDPSMVEAIQFFAKSKPTPEQVTVIPLGEDRPWKGSADEKIDVRYTEVQKGEDGAERYRDWVALYTNAHLTLQARLNAHCVNISQLYQVCFPWLHGPCPWIQCTSTREIPFQVVVADNLKHVLTKYFVRRMNLNKRHFEYYQEECSVMIVYVDPGDKSRLEMIRLAGLFA